jgi:hypothetical protein
MIAAMDTPEQRAAAALAPFLKTGADAKAAADAALAAAGALDALHLMQTSDGLVRLEARKALTPSLALMVRCMILADEEMRANPDAYEDEDDVRELMRRLSPSATRGRSGSTH